ncbi:MAG: hypothetical protein EA361_01560 [Bacteroidetes bacterium]|nr:MAG: hypothetical protein EA361_01560 [Bacteroidota bacterium]
MKTSIITLCTALALLLTPILLTANSSIQKLTLITGKGICIEYFCAIEEEVEENHSFNYKDVLKKEMHAKEALTSPSEINILHLIKEEEEVAEPQLDSLIIKERLQSGIGNAK